MDARITLLTLGVRDLDRARRFYRDGLGWRLSSTSTGEVAFFHTGGVVLALWLRESLAEDAHISPDGSGFAGVALAHNVPDHDDVDRVLAEAVAAGATLLKPAEDTFWGGRAGYFADPEGFPWEVAWNPFWPLRPDGSVELPA